jgi:hypothetical protein
MNRVLSGGRYPVLRSVAIIYLICTAVVIVAGVVLAIWELAAIHYDMMDRILLAVGTLAATVLAALFMLAVAEMLKMFMDIEHNTRTWMNASAPVPTQPLTGRFSELADETAEAALFRGH